MDNYLFGTLQGPFEKNINFIDIIQQQNPSLQIDSNISIIKLGICIDRKFDLQLQSYESDDLESLESYDIDNRKLVRKIAYFININNKNYQIGKTGILEFEDVNITSAAFLQDMDDAVYVNYIIKMNT